MLADDGVKQIGIVAHTGMTLTGRVMKYVLYNLQFCWGPDTENVYITQAIATRIRLSVRLSSVTEFKLRSKKKKIYPIYAKDAR